MRAKTEVEFEDLKGKSLVRITGEVDDDEMCFYTDNGEEYALYHCQDCCEQVALNDICGDLDNLIGTPIMLAEEVSSGDDDPEGYVHEYTPESLTWTFYKLATIKGAVTLRWLGESNGYYSEEVSFCKVHRKEKSNDGQ